jgi:hypothetical protein
MNSHMTCRALFFLFCSLFSLVSCDEQDAVEVAIEKPDRKTIDVARLGINAFANAAQFGSPAQQFAEVQGVLGVNRLRILMNWDDGVQASASSPINFSFYDDLVGSIPDGVQALIVLTNVPSWFQNPSSWSASNQRLSFVEQWIVPAVRRYRTNPHVLGFQIWNEPNNDANPQNTFMEVVATPGNYVEMLAAAYSAIKDLAPDKKVFNAATLPLHQNFPNNLKYNEKMRDLGVLQFLDVYAFHFYGDQYEKFIIEPKKFLNSLGKPLWATESGMQGFDQQLEFGERTWPWLFEQLPNLERVFIYQFAEVSSPATTFGLRNPSAQNGLSDLYVHLRDRNLAG